MADRSAGIRPVELRTENAENPLGLDEPRPRLSWRLEADPGLRGQRQSAYRVLVATSEEALARESDLTWDSGVVASARSVGLPYQGPPLASRTRYFWRVQVWDQDGRPSPWSATAWWEMGLLDPSEWQARWIGLPVRTQPWPGLEGVARVWVAGAPLLTDQPQRGVLRHRFEVPPGSRVLDARLRVGGGSWLTVYLNGQRLESEGEDPACLLAEVSRHLRLGDNLLAVEARCDPGRPAGVVARLLVTRAEGSPIAVASDDTWLAASEAPEGWWEPAFDDSGWARAEAVGRYGEPPWGREPPALRPSPLLRRSFALDRPVRRARLYASALGLYELYLNGRRVGDEYFTPGWTHYPARVQYQVYDVTALLASGENVLGAVLADGWYAGHVAAFGPFRYGTQPLLIAQLEVEHPDGSRTLVVSDGSWLGATGEILYADLIMGETVDARRQIPGWSAPGFEAAGWTPVAVAEPATRLVAQAGPPARVVMDLEPVAVAEPRPGVFVFDLGQNLVGWARLRVAGEPGRKVVLRFAEVLNPDGTLYTENLRTAQATDEYLLRGDGAPETFEPRFTYHGFRYVEVTGYPGVPSREVLVGRVVHADMPLTGQFECSHAGINQLQHNIQWSQRGNFLSVPTDCPQRDERLGWTGDAQVFCATAIFNMDVQRFLSKWMRDVMDAQRPSGAVPHVAPHLEETRLGAGAAGWADAVVIVPWTMYWLYGDERIVEECYQAMGRWVAYMERESPELVRPAEGFGDWLSIDAETPKDLIATAYFAYSARLLGELAGVLGRAADAERYADLYRRVRAAFRRRFVGGGGRVAGETQTAYVLALHIGLLEPEERPRAAERLVRDIRDRNWHLSTGFLGVSWLLPVLAENGHLDVAYRLLLQESYPSWLHAVRHGATTMWERWDSWTEGKGYHTSFTTEGHRTVNMNSFNHYAYGSVGQWLYSTVAGLGCLRPGYEEVRIRPRPGGGLTWARARYHSVRGPIACAWRFEGEDLRVEVEIPPNATAQVLLPAADPSRVREGGVAASEAPGVEYLGLVEEGCAFRVGSGQYAFTVSRA